MSCVCRWWWVGQAGRAEGRGGPGLSVRGEMQGCAQVGVVCVCVVAL